MTVTVRPSSVLRDYLKGVGELSVDAGTIREAMDQIRQTHRHLYVAICDETGALRRHVNVFVNDSNIRDMDGPDTQLAPGDIITLMPAVSGGSTCRNV